MRVICPKEHSEIEKYLQQKILVFLSLPVFFLLFGLCQQCIKAEECPSVNANQRVTEQRPRNEANNTRHNTMSLMLHSRSHFLSSSFAKSFCLLSSHWLLGFAVLGGAERTHVCTGVSSVALHPAFLATKTKLCVLSPR